MEIEKLIEQLQKSADFEDYPVVAEFAAIIEKKYLREAATALSTLQAENEKLRNEVERQRRSADDRKHLYENAERAYMKVVAELEQVKRERDGAIEYLRGICFACKNYSPYHNRGKCRYCAYEPARDKDAEANDNWEWSGQKKED